jgi:hypothetical protein
MKRFGLFLLAVVMVVGLLSILTGIGEEISP